MYIIHRSENEGSGHNNFKEKTFFTTKAVHTTSFSIQSIAMNKTERQEKPRRSPRFPPAAERSPPASYSRVSTYVGNICRNVSNAMSLSRLFLLVLKLYCPHIKMFASVENFLPGKKH
jgi:hypothetical protein